MAGEDALEYPDARITLSVKCENGDLESGLQQLHPILRAVVVARMAALGIVEPEEPPVYTNPHFGRLTFSQA